VKQVVEMPGHKLQSNYPTWDNTSFFLWPFGPFLGHGLPLQTSRSHSDTPHSVGLLQTSDQPVATTSTC